MSSYPFVPDSTEEFFGDDELIVPEESSVETESLDDELNVDSNDNVVYVSSDSVDYSEILSSISDSIGDSATEESLLAVNQNLLVVSEKLDVLNCFIVVLLVLLLVKFFTGVMNTFF